MCLGHLLPPAKKLSFRPERADAFSSRSLLRTRRLAQWRNLSSIAPKQRRFSLRSVRRRGFFGRDDFSHFTCSISYRHFTVAVFFNIADTEQYFPSLNSIACFTAASSRSPRN